MVYDIWFMRPARQIDGFYILKNRLYMYARVIFVNEAGLEFTSV